MAVEVGTVEEFKYLCLVLKHSDFPRQMLLNRLKVLTYQASQLKTSFIYNNGLSQKSRLIVLDALVRGSGLYGCEIWTNQSTELDHVSSIINRVMKQAVSVSKSTSSGLTLLDTGMEDPFVSAHQRQS